MNAPLRGAGSSLSSGKSGSNDKNTLFANSTGELLMVLSEGPIKGIDGLKSLYLDGTRVENDAGEVAIDGVKIYSRNGLPSQSSIAAFQGVSTTIAVGVRVYHANPITRSLDNPSYTSAVVTMRFPALVDSTDKGLKKTSATFRIEVAYDGGSWVNPFDTDLTVSGKTTSSYEQQYAFTLPVNPSGDSSPWSIRITRVSDDSEDDDVSNESWLASLTGIIDTNLSYPDTALIGLKFDAKEFSGSIPTVEVIPEGGIYLQVPSNYDPDARTYTGIWDGTFKSAYSTNPAWFYYTMAVNKRWGAGRFLDVSAIDKWSLYSIAQVCDEMVDNGYGGTEPRFEINAYITSEEELYDMMQLIASAFRGMSYWSSGAVTATQDTLDDPKVLVTRANTIGGEISYASSSLTARHTVAYVKYADASDEYRDAIEVVRDDAGILRYGERVKEVDAFGCTSRAAARRLGRWILLTETYETETVTYQAGLDHAVRRPGDIVSIMDAEKSNVDFGGRTGAGSTTTVIRLDRPIDFDGARTYTLHVTLPDGSLAAAPVVNPGVSASTVTLSAALAAAPLDAALWILSSDAVSPKPYRIISISEREATTFEVTALEVYTPKYALIDDIGTLDPPSYRQPSRPDAPSGVTFKESFYWLNGSAHTELLISWSEPSTMYTPLFRVEIDTPNGTNEYVTKKLEATSYTITDAPAGDYTIRVWSLSPTSSYRSTVATATFTAQGASLAGTFTIGDVAIEGESGHEFFARALALTWSVVDPKNSAKANTLFQQARVEVYDNTDSAAPVLMGTHDGLSTRFAYSWSMHKADAATLGLGPRRQLLFKIYAQDTLGRWGIPTSFVAYNTAPEAPVVSAIGSIKSAFVTTTFPADKDVQGQRIHASTVAGFTPAVGNLMFDGASSSAAIVFEAAGTYYLKVGVYDSWSTTPENYTADIAITVSDVVIDNVPPAIPTGLALSSSSSTDGDGTVRIKLVCDWNDNTESDLAGYDVEIKEGAGSYIGFPTTQSHYEVTVAANTAYTVHVRARDTSNNLSGYCDDVSITTARDTVAPAAPTDLSASAGFGVIWLRFTGAADADLDHYDVYEAAAATPAPVAGTVASFVASGTTVARSGLANGVTRYYWVRSVDTSGNASAWVGPVSATTVQINVSDITDGALTAVKFASSIKPVEIVSSLPTTALVAGRMVFLTSDSKLYRYTGSNWTTAVDGADIIANSIVAGKIAAGAISATEIAAGAIVASKLSIGDTSNAWPDPDLLDASLYSSSTGSAYNIWKSSAANYSWSYINMSAAATTGDQSVETAWQQCETSADYFASAIANLTVAAVGGESVEAYVSLGSLASTGVVSETRRVLIGTRTSTSSTPLTTTLTTTGSEKRFRFVFVSKQGTGSGLARFSAPILRRRANGALIVDGSITASKLVTDTAVITGVAQIADAIITGAKIVDATIVNAKIVDATITSAKIHDLDAAKVTISGSTTLASWRNGTDATLIEGGKIAANTISANKLEIGSRGLTISGLAFEHNSPAANSVSWTAGSIGYTADNGSVTTVAIAAGSAAWTSGTLYVYWLKGSTSLSTSTSAANSLASNAVQMASYRGGTDLIANYGRTIIDGSNIKTDSITADQLAAYAITAAKLAAGAVTATAIASDAILAHHISISNPTNMVPDNQLADIDAWTTSAATGVSIYIDDYSYGSITSKAWRVTGTGTASSTSTYIASAAGKSFPVTGGKEYAFGGIIDYNSGSTGGARIYIQWMDSTGTWASTSAALGYVSYPGSNPHTLSGVATAPDGTIAARLILRRGAETNGGTVTGTVYFVGAYVRERFGGELIVDGSITAAKISVTSLAAVSANLGTVTAGIIQGASGAFSIDLDAGTISYPDGSVSTSALSSGAVSNIVVASSNTLTTWSMNATFTVISASITPNGGKCIIDASFNFATVATVGTWTYANVYTAADEVTLEIYRGSTLIRSIDVQPVIDSSGTSAYSEYIGLYFIHAVDTSPGTSAVTYTFKATMPNCTLMDSSKVPKINAQFISVTNIKR